MTDPTPPGWYPYDADTQGYWDGERWTEHRAPAVAQKKSVPQWRIWLGCVVVFVALAGLWSTGMFDQWLAPIGLNSHECAKNLITGAYLCGDDLDAFCNTSLGSHADVC